MLLGCLALTGPVAPVRAQEGPRIDWGRTPILPSDLNPGLLFAAPAAPARPNRVRLLGFEPGFLSDPVGLDQDDPPAIAALRPPEPDNTDNWLTISHGNDNPYFEFRPRGDPGGVGFYRVNTQVQLFDSASTAMSVGVRAVTPAGLQYDGLPDHQGPTVFTPRLSLFHALDEGTAVHTFVGKNWTVVPGGNAPVRTDITYGMAVQQSLAPASSTTTDPLRNFYVSVGALGQYRMTDTGSTPITWEVLPGFHWKVADNWWLSGTMVVPVSSTYRDNAGRWQFTCSLRF
jgi:hypothetical protein